MSVTMTTTMIMKLIKTFSAKLLIMVYCAILFRGSGVESVRINKVSSPQSVESGSSQTVTLECQLEINESYDEKLVLKWFRKGDSRPIYQYIQARDTTTFSDQFKPFVDNNADESTNLGSIRLTRLPHYLSGDYECSVSTLESHDSKTTQLIVYVKAKTFDVQASEAEDGINITCLATGLFPEPQIKLFRIRPNNESYSNSMEIKDKTLTFVTRDKSGHYSISLSTIIYENTSAALDVTDHYECILELPETDYKDSKHIAIQAGWHTRPLNNSSKNKFNMASSLISRVLPLLAVIIIRIRDLTIV